MLDLGDGKSRRGRHDRVEVARGLAIDEVAFAVGLPGMYDCEVGDETALHDISLAVKIVRLLAFGDQGSNTGFGKKGGYPGAARSNAFGQRSLWIEFEFEFTL